MGAREVWITGLGAATAAGPSATDLMGMLREGRGGVRALADLGGRYAGRAPEPARQRLARHLDRSGRLFCAAADEAWQDARLPERVQDPAACGVLEGSSLGPTSDLLAAHARRYAGPRKRPAHPAGLVTFMNGAGGAAFAQAHGLEGPGLYLSTGSVSAACALGEALLKIQAGQLELAAAGGAECPLCLDILDSFDAAGILADRDGSPCCRPFDARSQGTLLGEGAGALVIEAASHARRRGADPRAVLLGYGFGCESASMTGPHPEGKAVATAAQRACARLGFDAVGWIKAHGTGTRLNDRAEFRGLSSALGPRLAEVPLVSLKSTLGHCLGASGAVETVGAVLALVAGFVPATLGSRAPDPQLQGCRLSTRVEPLDARGVLMLSESFGGRCAALLAVRPT